MQFLACPTPEGPRQAIFCHRISAHDCARRQKAFYHRCGQCKNAKKRVYVTPKLVS